jgi:hypothetical protein
MEYIIRHFCRFVNKKLNLLRLSLGKQMARAAGRGTAAVWRGKSDVEPRVQALFNHAVYVVYANSNFTHPTLRDNRASKTLQSQPPLLAFVNLANTY